MSATPQQHALVAAILEQDDEIEQKLHEQKAKAAKKAVESAGAEVKSESKEASVPDLKKKHAPPPLNRPSGRNIVKNEQPWHRLFIYALLQGATLKQCAEEFNKSREYLSALKRQPWFQKLMVEIADQKFENNITGLLSGAAVGAVETLVELAAEAESESVRRSAASDLLSSYFKHKPPDAPTTTEDPQAEAEQLDAEIALLEEREAKFQPNK